MGFDMGVLASISIKLNNEYITSIVNFGGYLYHTGDILLNYYKTQDSIEHLIKLGDLISLEKSTSKPIGHSVSNSIDGYCLFCIRDNDEKCAEYKTNKLNSETLFDECKYSYLFEDGFWYFSKENNPYIKLTHHQIYISEV